MKKLLLILTIYFMSSICWAAPEYITLYCASITTNASSVTTNAWPNFVSGEVKGVFLYWSGTAGATGDVDIVTTTAGASSLAQTIFSADDVTGDAYYPVRIPTVTTGGVTDSTTNDYTMIQLVSDKVELRVGQANTNGVNLRVLVILKKE